jgi:conserved oligomeric Golgi complex subunit 2
MNGLVKLKPTGIQTQIDNTAMTKPNTTTNIEDISDHFSFQRNDFLASDFSPISFLAQRKHLPIDQLKHDFASILKILRGELVELINNDYASFIELSSNLNGVEGMIQALMAPLSTIRLDIFQLHQSLRNVAEDINSKLEQRALVKKSKQSLQTLVSNTDKDIYSRMR